MRNVFNWALGALLLGATGSVMALGIAEENDPFGWAEGILNSQNIGFSYIDDVNLPNEIIYCPAQGTKMMHLRVPDDFKMSESVLKGTPIKGQSQPCQ